jgi:hypothetical protein
MKLELAYPARIQNNKRFEADMISLLRSGPLHWTKDLSVGEQVGVIPSGLLRWNNLLLDHYPHSTNHDYASMFQHSHHARPGYFYHRKTINADICRESIPHLSKYDSRSYPYLMEEHAPSTVLLMQEIEAYLLSSFSAYLDSHSLRILPWRIFYYQLQEGSQTLSNKWHYDLEVPKNCFFVMVYLNDSPSSGTSIYDSVSSGNISATHGYISSPPDYRASDLSFYHFSPNIENPFSAVSETGSVLGFFPSMCLHKGFFTGHDAHSSTPRHVLHLSFVVISRNVEVSQEFCYDSLATAALSLPKGRSFAPFLV